MKAISLSGEHIGATATFRARINNSGPIPHYLDSHCGMSIEVTGEIREVSHNSEGVIVYLAWDESQGEKIEFVIHPDADVVA